MAGFGESLRKNVTKILSDLDTAISTDLVDTFIKGVDYSPAQPDAPYAAGHFINNWRLAVNSTSSENSSALSMEGTASRESIALLLTQKAFFGKDAFVTLTNNTEYGNKIEFLGWPSGKAPYMPLGNMITYAISKKK